MRIRTGDRVVDRYTLFEQVDDHWGVRGWRAHDEQLHRDVLVTTFVASDPRGPDLVASARRTAVLSDHRLVRVLDANITDEVGYVVREWVGGQSLADLLSNGPLEAAVALRITQDVAEAVAHAHRKGIAHLCLDPLTVILDEDGNVRVRGFGTAAVLRGVTPSAEGATADDIAGVGRVLYSCLTARYPGEAGHGIRPALRVDGRVPTPRQTRAGVPANLDRMTARAVPCGRTSQTRYTSVLDIARDAERLLQTRTSPSAPPRPEVALPTARRALRVTDRPAPLTVATDLDFAHLQAGSPPPALDPIPRRRRAGDRVDDRPAASASVRHVPPPPPPDDDESTVGRVALVVVAAALLVGALLLTTQAVRDASAPALVPQPSPAPTAAEQVSSLVPITPVEATDFDPFGDGEEAGEFAFHTIDGDPGTAWLTSVYFDPMELQKEGVGVVVDLGVVQQVDRVRVQLVGEPTQLQIGFAARETPETPTEMSAFRMVSPPRSFDEQAVVRTRSAEPTRYVLVWLRALPPVPGGWQGGIAEVEILG